MIWSLY